MLNLIHNFEKDGFELPNTFREEMKANLITQTFPRNSLLMQGDVSDKLYFVEMGLVRGFYEWTGKEYTSWFAQDGDFACSVRSFFRQTPSFETIQLLEETTLSFLRYQDIEAAITANTAGMQAFIRLLTEQYLLQYESRGRMLRGMSARERWDIFTTHHPALYSRVSLWAGSASVQRSGRFNKLCFLF